MKSLIFSLLVVFFFTKVNASKNFTVSNDSVKEYLSYSKDLNLSLDKRKLYLNKAYMASLRLTNDSIKNNYFLKISLNYYKLKDSLLFRKLNNQSFKLSFKLNDSISIAANYWDLARFYSNNGLKDSAYFKYFEAQKIYEAKKQNFFLGIVLYNMAVIQSDIKDYTGSNIATIKAIEVLKPLKKYKHLYRCYKNLGVNFNNLEQYDEAIFYHNKALEYQQKIKDENSYRASTFNNIGVVYEKQEKYGEAIKYYLKALEEKELRQQNTKLYAMLLDNLAYSKFKLHKTKNVENQFLESLQIRDSIKDYLGVAINKLHLSEFYLSQGDTTKAINYARETKKIAGSTKNHKELLSALLILSEIDEKEKNNHFASYVRLNDSLIKEERLIRNKFARIRFETDELIDKSQLLSRQNKNLLIIFSSALLLFLLLFIIRNQYIKNKVLAFEQQQQKTNEEIYNLMIAQQNKLDEGSRLEKKRISQELHDGVLGKLFGIRLILNTLNSKNDEATVSKRNTYLKELQTVEEELRTISHELNHYSQISNKGYMNMIETLLETSSYTAKFKYNITSDKAINWEELTGSLKMNFYRIIQEAIHNINKYASAKMVTIKFILDNNLILLDIIDDGVGFNKDKVKSGIGLKNIKSRVQKMNGYLNIESKANKGTYINIKVPIV